MSQATCHTPALPASYQFALLPDGESVLIEGRDDSAAAEAQSMINAYSKMVESQKRKTEEEKAKVEKLLLNSPDDLPDIDSQRPTYELNISRMSK